MNPHTYGHLIFDKEAENIQWKKGSLFKTWCWLNWQSACRRMKIDSFLYPCTKLKCKWIKDLYIKPGTLKLLEEIVGKSLDHTGISKIFQNLTQVSYALISRIDKWNLMKLQNFHRAKESVKK